MGRQVDGYWEINDGSYGCILCFFFNIHASPDL